MLTITMTVDAAPGVAFAVKEALAMDLERYGDVRVVSVEETAPEQICMGGFCSGTSPWGAGRKGSKGR